MDTNVAEDRIVPTWDQNVRVAQTADEAGWEFLLPLGRWRGFGGSTNHNGRQFEVYTWAAGLSAVTKQIQIFATSHVPLVHPVIAAKQAATIDLIGGGRFGLNIVAGWNVDEMAMFGVTQREHDERYAVAAEWLTIVERLWTDPEEFDFDGEYYSVRRGYLQPKPLQLPRPVLVNAGSSPAGMDFSTRFCDYSFQVIPDLEQLEQMNKDLRSRAANVGRDIGVLSTAYVVCADTEKEAQRFHTWYVDEMGDWEGAQSMVAQLVGGESKSLPDDFTRGMARALIAGWAAVPLVGTPEQIVDKMLHLKSIGTDGLGLSWLHYESGIDQFNEQVLPLMVEAGLRDG
jgi:alkanesulfonate monooxygenase SsuD/methylene tetrahydromethanopterin reductase-like flavin-dependent oxidoreductase (luciferase family)